MAENEPGQGAPKTPEDARIDSLEERLDRAQAKEDQRKGIQGPRTDENERVGQKVLSLLIGGLLGGTVIGYAADRIFDTGHMLLVLGLFLGIVGAFYSIIRVAGK